MKPTDEPQRNPDISNLLEEHIKAGDSPLECTVTYSPTMASSAVSLARLVAQGRKMSELAELQVPKLIILQSETITKSNVETYLPLGFPS